MKRLEAFCRNCGPETNHLAVWAMSKDDQERLYLICLGCDHKRRAPRSVNPSDVPKPPAVQQLKLFEFLGQNRPNRTAS